MDLFQGVSSVCSGSCHSTLPEVAAVFGFLMCFEGRPPEAVSLCEVFRCIRGGCGRRVFVVCYLVVLGLVSWPFSGSGDLLLLDLGVTLGGQVWGVWGLGGVFELVREGWHGPAPQCSLLGVLGRCMLPHRMVAWHAFPRRVEVRWGIFLLLD